MPLINLQVRRLSLLGGFTPMRGDGFESDYEVSALLNF